MGNVSPETILSKKQRIAMKIKEATPGLVYLKFFGNGRCEDGFLHNGQTFHNIVDIYALRRRLYTLKDVEKADFNTLLGQHFHEFNFAASDEPRFYSNFDTGNLWRVIQGTDDVYYAQMTADANSLGHQRHFHFAVSGLRKGITFKFRVFNFSREVLAKQIYQKSKKLFKKKEIGWVPLTTGIRCFANDQVVLDSCVTPFAKNKYTLEFECKPDFEDDVITFSILPPYSYEDLIVDSHTWTLKAKSIAHFHFTKKLLCYTLMGRKMFYYEAYKSDEKLKLSAVKGKRIMVVMARVHPGESNSSFTLKGFLDEFLEDTFASKFLRDHFFMIIIPMMNPDGVSMGHSRTSFAGQDLNQTWAKPDRYLHPEVYYIKKILKRLSKDNELVFAIDVHGSFIKKGVFGRSAAQNPQFGNVPEFSKFLSALINDFDEQASLSFPSAERRENSHVVLGSELGFVNSWALNCSTSGSLLYSAYGIYEFNKLGKDFVDALARYLCKKHPKLKTSSEFRGLSEETWKGCMIADSAMMVLKNSPPGSCRSLAAVDHERDGKYLMAFLRSHQRSLNKPTEVVATLSTPVTDILQAEYKSQEQKTEPKKTEDEEDSIDLDNVPRLGMAASKSQNMIRPTTALHRPESALKPLTRTTTFTKDTPKSGSSSLKKLAAPVVRSEKLSTKTPTSQERRSLVAVAMPEVEENYRKADFKISKPKAASKLATIKEPVQTTTPKYKPPKAPPGVARGISNKKVESESQPELVRKYEKSIERQFKESGGSPPFPSANLVDLKLEAGLNKNDSKPRLGRVGGHTRGKSGPKSDREGVRSLGKIIDRRPPKLTTEQNVTGEGWGLPKAIILGFDLSSDANRTIDEDSHRKRYDSQRPAASRSLKRRETIGPMQRRNSALFGPDQFFRDPPVQTPQYSWQPKPLGGRARPPKPTNKGSLPRAQRWDGSQGKRPARSNSKESKGLGIEGFEIMGSKGKDESHQNDWGYAPSPMIKRDPGPQISGDNLLRTVTTQMQQVAQRLESFHRMFSTPH